MKRILLLSCLILASVALHSQETAKATVSEASVQPSTVKLVCGPYLQNVKSDGFTVMWISDIDALGWVELAPDDGTNFYYTDRPKYYDMTGAGINPLSKIHTVRITGLQPGTRYRYRIMMKGLRAFNGERDITFTKPFGANVYSANPPVVTTLEESYDKLHVAIVNDVHADAEGFRNLFKDSRGKYDFVVFNGDMTSVINEETHMAVYVRPASELFADETPLYVVRGNHEFRGLFSSDWLKWFQTPTGMPYYTFQWGKFFFIVLDSGEDKPDNDIEYQGMLSMDQYLREQADWLKGVTRSEAFRNASVRIVFSHIPPRLKHWHGNKNVCELFVPILNEAGIDLMVSGHEHNYSLCLAGTSNANFPVLVNDNLELMVMDIDGKTISFKTSDPSGTQTHKGSFPVVKK
ncbi:MAG: metallophosphoesterase [Bacteroidales bacterium]|nr:metallophosphoesterase [Bacteroidales bacterium]